MNPRRDFWIFLAIGVVFVGLGGAAWLREGNHHAGVPFWFWTLVALAFAFRKWRRWRRRSRTAEIFR